MTKIVKANGMVKSCCMPDNMERRKSEDPDIMIDSCKTCGARHYVANANPAPFFVGPLKGRSMVGGNG